MSTTTAPQLTAEAMSGLTSREIKRPTLTDADRFRDKLAPVNPGACDFGDHFRCQLGISYSAIEQGVIPGMESSGEQRWTADRFDCCYFGPTWEAVIEKVAKRERARA